MTYLGDGNYIGSTIGCYQVVTNHPPTAMDVVYYRAKAASLNIAIADLLTNVTDLDGDAITLQSVGTGSAGATITTNNLNIYYLPGTGVAATATTALPTLSAMDLGAAQRRTFWWMFTVLLVLHR